MDKEFGRQKNQCWVGVRIKYDNFEEDGNMDDLLKSEISEDEL